jgi:hypothetical protein
MREIKIETYQNSSLIIVLDLLGRNNILANFFKK